VSLDTGYTGWPDHTAIDVKGNLLVADVFLASENITFLFAISTLLVRGQQSANA
jgi:hypothetical protein